MSDAKELRNLMATEGAAVSRNTKGFNQGRYESTGRLDDYEGMKQEARAIKADAIERLPDLIDQLRETVEDNGGTLYIADDAADANDYVRSVVDDREAERVVKSKSMTSEEIEVNEALEADGREGVVMKSPDASTFLKYTTGWANRDDLRYAFSLPFDRGRDFTFRRLVREAYQSIERGEDAEAARERARAIGEAILEPMLDCIETVATGDPVGERHTVRAPPAVVDELLAHFDAQGLHLQVESDRREGDERVVTFLKVSRKSTDTAELYLDGHVVQE